VVPVASKVRCCVWNRHDVAGAGGDVTVASRAEIRLGGLVRLDPSDLDIGGCRQVGVHPSNAQITVVAQMASAAATSR